ncbi:protein MNN4-like [Cucumis melo var. makuwa]|uniref:Protein MNN4-like n=1 Tax=Cucumis melo var. makuwa TaxID=1194695 RepID=A0A5D3DX47_CUCMM|nr:protein MNN4-like [Cucumis melo var. makuwa]TYK28263.1 protein MNN4-like [Cucumis melo var. makuwa]
MEVEMTQENIDAMLKVARKPLKKTEKLKKWLLKIKVKAQCVKALAEEKKGSMLREREELLNEVDKMALLVNKSKGKEKTIDGYDKEFEKELEEFISLEDGVVEKQPKKKKASEGQDATKREKKNKKAQQEKESQESEQGVLSIEELGKHFMIEKGLFPVKGQLPSFLDVTYQGTRMETILRRGDDN